MRPLPRRQRQAVETPALRRRRLRLRRRLRRPPLPEGTPEGTLEGTPEGTEEEGAVEGVGLAGSEGEVAVETVVLVSVGSVPVASLSPASSAGSKLSLTPRTRSKQEWVEMKMGGRSFLSFPPSLPE